MARSFCFSVAIIATLLIITTSEAEAKSATQVFEKVSKSIVVVVAYNEDVRVSSFGSGVVLTDGTVATSCHVIENSCWVEVHYEGKKYLADSRYRRIKCEACTREDICTLQVEKIEAPPVTLGDTNRLKVGERVYAIGAPEGLELTLSEGIISSLREVEDGRYIQNTAPISPGSSGGGLFDDDGRLIGMVCFYLKGGQNLNFALPVEWISKPPASRSSQKTAILESLSRFSCTCSKELSNFSGNYQQMELHAKRWIDIDPDSPNAWITLGTAYLESEQIDKAFESFKHAHSLNGRKSTIWYWFGRTYAAAGDNELAIEAFKKALAEYPNYNDACYRLGQLYKKSGDTKKVMEAYRKLKEIHPATAKKFFDEVVVGP